MQLNNLSPAAGSKKNRKRVGRGIGCTSGKTCGRGHKGQHSRSGGYHKVGFEGGQMPLQRRLPKIGFYSRKGYESVEVRLYQLTSLSAEIITIQSLKEAGIVPRVAKKVKIINTGEITKAYKFEGISVTKGARLAIESAGGSIG